MTTPNLYMGPTLPTCHQTLLRTGRETWRSGGPSQTFACLASLFKKADLGMLNMDGTKMVFPSPPEVVGQISGERVRWIMHELYGISTYCEDGNYDLIAEADINRFLKAYDDPFKYTADIYDCGNFSIQLLAAYDKWVKGKALKGYIWAWRNHDEEALPEFGPHSFNYFVLPDERVVFADQLRVAAPKDECMEAYPLTKVMLSMAI